MRQDIRLGKYLKTTLTVGDFAVLNLVFLLTVLLIGEQSAFSTQLVWLIANVSFVPSVFWFSSIHNLRIIYADKLVIYSVRAVGLQAMVMMCLLFAFDIFAISMRACITFLLLFTVMIAIWWVFSRWLLKRLRRMGFNFKKVVIIGSGRTARMVYDELGSDAGYGYRVMGIFDNPQGKTGFARKNVHSLESLEAFVKREKIDIIYYTLSAEDRLKVTSMILIAEENGADFVYVPSFHKVLSGQFEASNVGNLPSMSYAVSPLMRTSNKFMKRAFDLLFSSAFLIVSPLIFIPIAIGIKLTSPGPIFFKQKRTGIRGAEFICYKFRTMKVNADSDRVQATKDDPRKTKFGDFLRRSSLDELPQFINVWLGNMSVVGPRPHMISHTEQYSAVIDKYMVRHAVKPGITGWAQVNGYRGGTKHLWQMEKRVEYDVWYIRNWNMFLDLKIIFLTMFNGLRGEQNAY